MINYKNRLPGSFIEEKEYSVAWHFRNSDSVFSGVRIKEFMYDIVQFTARNEIEVLMGNKVVEIKCAGVNKGDAAKKILSYADYDFIMAAGDDTTDESLFQVLPKEAYSVSIGKRNSLANFYLDSNSELLEMLDKMIGRKVDFVRNIIDFFNLIFRMC